ncbi:MAG: hypothetical protein JXD22_16905 [Sedimentisphaerales bacterium]|nr:hypothetical protein [Sedimentisphaerales bacterium]
MLGYSKIKHDVFIFEKQTEPFEAKIKINTLCLPVNQLSKAQWHDVKSLQGKLAVSYLKWRYGSPETYVLLAYADKALAHIGWVVPAKKIMSRYPFVTKNSYFIIACLTSPDFRGMGIYPSQLQKIVNSEIPNQLYWGMAACDNIPSLKGIHKAGGIKVGEYVQQKWLYGCFSKTRSCSVNTHISS